MLKGDDAAVLAALAALGVPTQLVRVWDEVRSAGGAEYQGVADQRAARASSGPCSAVRHLLQHQPQTAGPSCICPLCLPCPASQPVEDFLESWESEFSPEEFQRSLRGLWVSPLAAPQGRTSVAQAGRRPDRGESGQGGGDSISYIFLEETVKARLDE